MKNWNAHLLPRQHYLSHYSRYTYTCVQYMYMYTYKVTWTATAFLLPVKYMYMYMYAHEVTWTATAFLLPVKYMYMYLYMYMDMYMYMFACTHVCQGNTACCLRYDSHVCFPFIIAYIIQYLYSLCVGFTL